MGYRNNLYDLVLVLHLLGVVVGLGTVALNGLYATNAKRAGGAQGLAITESTIGVARVAELVIYTIPISGILLVVLSDDVIQFSELWISLSFLLFIVAIGLLHGVMKPAQRKIVALQKELLASGGTPQPGASAAGAPPQLAELDQLGRRAGLVGAALNLLLIALIVLMVFKPGSELL